MVHIVATIRVKSGCMGPFLEIFKENVPKVMVEEGCVEYRPTIDLDTGLPRQVSDADTMVLIEKWQSLEALKVHLASAHMMAYREKVKDLVVETSLRVLRDA